MEHSGQIAGSLADAATHDALVNPDTVVWSVVVFIIITFILLLQYCWTRR